MAKLVIIGTNALAEIANEYFTHDSDYKVAGFSVERKFAKHNKFLNMPLIPFDEIEKFYNPQKYFVFISLGYGHMNNDRARLYLNAKSKGYRIASYISSKAFVWKNVKFGENCFIFEDNTIQPFVEVGNNVIMWSGNHIGHHSIIGDHNFFSSHVVLSGNCRVGNSCFFGVNSTIADGLKIGASCLVGAGANVTKDLEISGTYIGNPAKRINDG